MPAKQPDSECGHGAFRTQVRRLPKGELEKGPVILGSRGNRLNPPPGKEATGPRLLLALSPLKARLSPLKFPLLK